jgi:glutathione S-transferase
MKLYYTPIDQYVHTIEAVIAHTDLAAAIDPVPTKPFEPNNGLAELNPLITVPTLQLDDTVALYGGPVIYEYLDGLHDNVPLFPAGSDSVSVRRQLWLADGLFDTIVRIIVEGWYEAFDQRREYLDRCWAKVNGALNTLDIDAATWNGIDIAQVRAVGALSFLDLKGQQIAADTSIVDADFDWRDGRRSLSEWYEAFSQNPIFRFNLFPSPS